MCIQLESFIFDFMNALILITVINAINVKILQQWDNNQTENIIPNAMRVRVRFRVSFRVRVSYRFRGSYVSSPRYVFSPEPFEIQST